ncbi:MAG: GNAT family N-acetyltransferase [Cytophagaceae bacterium]|jgi:hypothetical protein|nr:GNAT family N-acetyltransferase [Cytophagaceae bacterium]
MSLADKNSLFKPVFEPFWFTQPDYPQAWRWRWLVVPQGAHAKAWMPVVEQEHVVQSGFQAPFGGPDGGGLKEWIELVSSFLDTFSGKRLQITLPPECYRSAEEADLMHQLLLRLGFQVSVEEQNYHVSTLAPFDSLLHDSEIRRLRKARLYGVQFKVNEVSWEKAFDLIVQCRQRKGFPISMAREAFLSLPILAPQRYTLFSVHLMEEVLAVAVGVRVRSDILYFFLPADDHRYLNLSPMALLKEGMYLYCQEQSIGILDYGIGTVGGVPNEGLIRFKKNMGGSHSPKRTYIKV